MKKFNNRKVLVGVLVFVLSFLIFKIDVNAYCTYEFVISSENTLYNDSKYDLRDKKKITLNASGGIIGASCEDIDDGVEQVSSVSCWIKDDDAKSSLFILDNNKLYCPNKIYVNNNTSGSTLSNYYSFAKNARTDSYCREYSWGKCIDTLSLSSVAVLTDAKNNSYEYTVIENEDGSFSPGCKAGWEEQVAEYDSWWGSYSNIINTIGMTASMVDEYNKMIADHAEYCGYKPDTEFQAKEKENYKTITANASEDEETQAALEKLEETVVELEEKVIEYQMNVGFSDDIISCQSLLDKDLKLVIQLILKIIRIAVPILLIVLVTIDFASAVISNDQDAVKKAVSKTIKRAIAALAFFFVPLIVSLMLDWLVIYKGELKIENETIDCSEVLK